MTDLLPKTLELMNETLSVQRIYVEPWGEELAMPPGAHWVVEAMDLCHACLTVSLHQDGIAIHSEPEAQTRVFSKGDSTLIWEA